MFHIQLVEIQNAIVPPEGENSRQVQPPGAVDNHLSFDTPFFISTSHHISDTYLQVMTANPTAWSSLPVVGAMLATDVRNKSF